MAADLRSPVEAPCLLRLICCSTGPVLAELRSVAVDVVARGGRARSWR